MVFSYIAAALRHIRSHPRTYLLIFLHLMTANNLLRLIFAPFSSFPPYIQAGVLGYMVLTGTAIFVRKAWLRFVLVAVAFGGMLWTLPYGDYSRLNSFVFPQLLFYAFFSSAHPWLAIVAGGCFISIVLNLRGLIEPSYIRSQLTGISMNIVIYTTLSFIINRLLKQQKQLQESEHRFRNLVEFSPEPIVLHEGERLIYGNPAAARFWASGGRENQEQFAVGSAVLLRQFPDTPVSCGASPQWQECTLVQRDGELRDCEIFSVSLASDGRPSDLTMWKDITERKKIAESMRHMAYHDALTGLPNRSMLLEKLQERLSDPAETEPFAILFIDLDRFKNINDALGHRSGDGLLVEVGKRLTHCLGEGDLLVRHGGDEFIYVSGPATSEQITAIGKRVLRQFDLPFEVEGHRLSVTPSIGIAAYPEDGMDSEALMKHADMAMYVSKKFGGNRCTLYTDHREQAERRTMIEHHLQRALDEEQFYLEYQPLIDLESGDINGVEALIRWRHETLGFVSPLEFIPVAEENGMIHALGEWVLRTACVQYSHWRQNAAFPFKVSVNVSAKQLENPVFVSRVAQILKETGMEPERLKIEITESVMLHPNETIPVLHRLKLLGVHLALDDFGTGFSSLSMIGLLPIDEIKIDKSFIQSCLHEDKVSSIVVSMIDLCHRLGFSVVAEGIETPLQMDYLRKHQCDVGQGYYFSKPLPADMLGQVTRLSS